MVENQRKNLILSIAIIIAGLVIAGAIIYINQGKGIKESGPTAVVQPETSPAEEELKEETPPVGASLEAFAKCLNQKGMKFYGAYWCGWCNKQKELFGEAAQYLPYIECSDKETGELTPECQTAGITGFPTWGLPDGTKYPGFKTLENLAELSGCQL